MFHEIYLFYRYGIQKKNEDFSLKTTYPLVLMAMIQKGRKITPSNVPSRIVFIR